MTKEQILKMIEGRIDTITDLASESIELIYNAGYNDGIEDAINKVRASNSTVEYVEAIRKLKK